MLSRRPRSHFPSSLDRHGSEGRALQFFQEVVGPALSGPADDYFWNQLLLQFSHYEPAVRHATIAVSAMYEQLQGRHDLPLLAPQDILSALRHYNAAIQHLVSEHNEALTLLVCVLFICTEFMQGNEVAAIRHCRHGITIFNKAGASYPWLQQHLFPILCRLSVMPLFFGTSVSSFPAINGLYAPIPTSFGSLADAQHALDNLICRSMRFVRFAYEYKLGSPQSTIPTSMSMKQHELRVRLEEWRASYTRSSSSLENLPPIDIPARARIQMQHLIATVWVNMALERGEEAYDTNHPTFQSIVNLASSIASRPPCQPTTRPRFVFEMGFLPLLYFVVLKCRVFDLRLRALSLMKTLAIHRENLWDISTMYSVGRRVIEIEHGVELDAPLPADSTDRPMIPPGDKRLVDAIVISDTEVRPDEAGCTTTGWKVQFLTPTTGGGFCIREELVSASH